MSKSEMRQSKTDYSERGETGEKEPKGAISSDRSGDRKERLVAGVGMGMKDGIGARESGHMGKHDGNTGEFNDGTTKGTCYTHKRMPHEQD